MSAHTHVQQLEGLDESLTSQHKSQSDQLRVQGVMRRLLGGSARGLAAADDEEDESYDDDLDIDEPLTAGQASPSQPSKRRSAFRTHSIDTAPQLMS